LREPPRAGSPVCWGARSWSLRMLPKISLMEELKKGGYEASLTTTYNAYLPFYEEVVLRRLVNAGIRGM